MKKKNSKLYDKKGRRKYLTAKEHQAFLDACYDAAAHERSFCFVLAYTGCHVIEALEITAANIDLAGDAIIFNEENGRGRGVPVPSSVIQSLEIIHGIRRSQKTKDGGKSAKLWPVERTTAWRWVCRIMKEAKIKGPKAAPRGLRHGFAIDSIKAGVPLKTVQQWMGHKDLETTIIYADAITGYKP